MDERSKRTIQILRAFGICMVCIHHTLTNLPDSIGGGYLLRIVNADVVVFFMISGFLFESKVRKYRSNKIAFLLAKVKQLVVPYLFWSLIIYVATIVIHRFIGDGFSSILDKFGFYDLTVVQIAKNVLFFQNYYVEHLWYLYVLFVFLIVCLFLGKMTYSPWIILVEIIFAAILNYTFDLPYIVWKILKHYSDFAIGRLIASRCQIRSSENIEPKRHKWFLITSAVIFVPLLVLVNGGMEKIIDASFIRNILINIAQHLFYWDVVLMLLLAAWLISVKAFSKYVKVIGDYSYDIYLMHTPYVVPVCAKLLATVGVPAVANLIITVLLGMLLPLIISKFIVRRIPIICNILLGRSKTRKIAG